MTRKRTNVKPSVGRSCWPRPSLVSVIHDAAVVKQSQKNSADIDIVDFVNWTPRSKVFSIIMCCKMNICALPNLFNTLRIDIFHFIEQ